MVEHSTSSIVVQAPAKAIMEVIADVEQYPAWVPSMTSAELLAVYEEDDRPYQARFVLDQAGFREEHVYAYEWFGDREVRWQLDEPGGLVSDLHGCYSIVDATEGGAEVTYALSVEMSIPMIGLLRRRAEKLIIDSALRGLKRRVEG